MKKVLSVLLVVLMLTAVFAVAAAATDNEYPSPSDRDYFVVEVNVDGNGTGTVDNPTPPKGDTVKLVAKPGDGAEFKGWTFEGEFEWVEGDANSLTIVIRPKEDLKFIAHFTEGKKDSGKTSPTTGYNTASVIAAMAVVLTISAAVVVVNGKRYFSAK